MGCAAGFNGCSTVDSPSFLARQRPIPTTLGGFLLRFAFAMDDAVDRTAKRSPVEVEATFRKKNGRGHRRVRAGDARSLRNLEMPASFIPPKCRFRRKVVRCIRGRKRNMQSIEEWQSPRIPTKPKVTLGHSQRHRHAPSCIGMALPPVAMTPIAVESARVRVKARSNGLAWL